MTRIFWDAFFLISGTFSMSVVLNGSLFTFGAGSSNSTIIEASISIEANSTTAPSNSTSTSTTACSSATTAPTATTDLPPVKNSLFMFDTEPSNSKNAEATVSISVDANSTSAPSNTTSSSAATTTTKAATTANIPPVKKFVAAAVRSHFDDCPNSHQHFCFHGTCRFLILEETPACICHPGFVGMRCEHADLLAVVATNHRQQTVATVLVLCVIGCVFIMLLCTLLHCWWRQDCRRRRHAHHHIPQKHGASYYPSESVV